MKKNRRFLAVLLTLWMTAVHAAALAEEASSVQIRQPGGSADGGDGVTIEKMIAGTPHENEFEITLRVTTRYSMEKLRQLSDAAVVLVLDVSNTMNNVMDNGQRRIDAAQEAACAFIDDFCNPAHLLGADRALGFVTFGQHARTEFELETLDVAAPNAQRDQWKARVNGTSAGQNGQWTNIEGGLQLAQNLLKDSSAAHRFIVLITDGFPTTYIHSGSDSQTAVYGYETSPSTGGVYYEKNRFYDHEWGTSGVECSGTSYSDTAAIRARQAAERIKQSGIDIFSIGIGLTQTIKGHIDSASGWGSIVERGKGITGGRFEIGSETDTNAYRSWLGGNGKNGGIGGGPNLRAGSEVYDGSHGAYADANTLSVLNNVFGKLIAQFETINEQSIKDTWIAADPMGGGVAFQGFVNKGENTASETDGVISWDLKASPCTVSTSDATTFYTYQLQYRVRLCNEKSGFSEKDPYPTNGAAQLHYRVDDNGNLSPDKTLDFPIPAVEGYLADLIIRKTTNASAGFPPPDVRFRLTHATDCPECSGAVFISEQTGVSAGGTHALRGIPSGHRYILTETPPPGYEPPQTYVMTIAYDQLSLTDQEGREVQLKEGTANIQNRLLPASIVLTARKTFDGKPAKDPFFFELADAQGRVIERAANDENGRVTFSPLTYDAGGAYTYTVREAAGSNVQIEYSRTIYTVTVTVSPSRADGWQAQAAFREGASVVSEMLFENRTARFPPSTGDHSKPLLWAIAAALAFVGAGLLILNMQGRWKGKP